MKTTLMLCVVTLVSACGDDDDDGRLPPPTRAGDGSDLVFALEPGNYYVERIWNLNDGCRRNPLDPQDPITTVNYAVTNDGSGNVSVERCIHDGSMTSGQILGNRGVLTVTHDPRRDAVGPVTAEYRQECTLDVRLLGDNVMEAHFVEKQTGRNSTMRSLTVDTDECATSYTMIMRKRTP